MFSFVRRHVLEQNVRKLIESAGTAGLARECIKHRQIARHPSDERELPSMTAAWRIYREEPLENLAKIAPGSTLFDSPVTLTELLVWASQYGSNSFGVSGPSTAARSAQLRQHCIAVTVAAIEECEPNKWPIASGAEPSTPPVATIEKLWSGWFGSLMPDMNDRVEPLPMEAYFVLASSQYVDCSGLALWVTR